MHRFNKPLLYVAKIFLLSGMASIVAHLIFFIGYLYGFSKASFLFPEQSISKATVSSTVDMPTPTPRTIVITPTFVEPSIPNWSGPELWEAVNKKRQSLGVNPLGNQSELCTIASIRLNEILELGKLDGHEGFSSLPDRRTDLKWIFEKYNISEFLVSGAGSAEEAVELWFNTLGHKKLLTGGEYVWGCTYAQNGFGVAIAAY